MALLNIAPTKTNMLRLRENLRFADQGYQLLDQKRNILTIELLTLVDQCVDFQNRVESALRGAYATLETAVLQTGRLKVAHVASAVNMRANITIRSRKVMGVILPVVDTNFIEKSPYFSPMGTSFWMDETLEDFKAALMLLGKLAELKISVLRLAREVHKTIRKVNALEKIAIPDLMETVKYVQERLDESDREMFVLMKKVKERLARMRAVQHSRQGE